MMLPQSNHLLAQLHEEHLDRLRPHLELCCLEAGRTLFGAHETIRFVYFPVSAVIALKMNLYDGISTDITWVGNEGMLGYGVMNSNQNFNQATVRFPGFAYKLPIDIFQQELAQNSAFLQIWVAATRQMIFQIALPSICSQRHTNEQQIIRWILTTLDKTAGQVLSITHQDMADILCMRRESVTLITRKFWSEGLITATRGKIAVRDRPGLEKKACACYHALRKSMGYPETGSEKHTRSTPTNQWAA
jgi:CRP-like cAMP-binding protein